MNEKNCKTAELNITGMTCGSCELILERKLMKIPGMIRVLVNHRTGVARVTAEADRLPDADAIADVIREAGYALADTAEGQAREQHEQSGFSHTGDTGGKSMLRVRIDGMTDRGCTRLVKGKLKLVEGVRYASVNEADGTANIHYRGAPPSWKELVAAVESAGFTLRRFDEAPGDREPAHKKWMEIGASLLIIFALYQILKTFDLISFASSTTAGAATFGGILLIGLVAGTSSCLAVTGGLLLSVAAKYNEAHHAQSRWEKFKPLLYFNAGRLFSYFLLGGLVGVLGRSVTLSPRMTGYMSIIVAVIMLYLALSILHIMPKGTFSMFTSKRLSHWIANLSESRHPAAPFGLGMFTFFLPCGFTQSLQLVALASGSFWTGSLTMFVFALGTLPALLGLSAISATAEGRSSRLFLRFSGTLVLVLALFNLNSGLILAGFDAGRLIPSFTSSLTPGGNDSAGSGVTIRPDGTQVIDMKVDTYGYSPNSFTVSAGKPTILRATAGRNAAGCASALTIPNFDLVAYLKPGTVSELGPFVPTKNFLITCSMGMYRAYVTVN